MVLLIWALGDLDDDLLDRDADALRPLNGLHRDEARGLELMRARTVSREPHARLSRESPVCLGRKVGGFWTSDTKLQSS
jgi:hypothetical protein